MNCEIKESLAALSNESRMITAPWSRMVRGLGLGQYPADYHAESVADIRKALGLLEKNGLAENNYLQFCMRLSSFILTFIEAEDKLTQTQIFSDLADILLIYRKVENSYWRLMTGCILLGAMARLGLDIGVFYNQNVNLPDELLRIIDEIKPDQIKDDNKGRHGEYEKLSAYTAIFIAFGQSGLKDLLIKNGRDYIQESLSLLEQIPSPFFRGRGGAMLISAISLLGFHAGRHETGRDYIQEVLDYLDCADEIQIDPVFPQPMSAAFSRIYPLLTMLNAIAMSGEKGYLTYRHDRLAAAKTLWSEITPVEQTHMGLYYLMALFNLGALEEQIEDIDAFMEELIGQWRFINPGENFFLHGISYSYLIETATITGRSDLLHEEIFESLADSFSQMTRYDLECSNRPYPFSYALNMLGEIGRSELLFQPRPVYGNMSPAEWLVSHLSPGGAKEGASLFMLGHCLVNYALRFRGKDKAEPEIFRRFEFKL